MTEIRFPDQIKQVQEELSPTARRFLEHVESRPRLADRKTFAGLYGEARELVDHISGIPAGGDFGLQPWPLWLGAERRRGHERLAVGIARLTRDLPRRLFDADPQAMAAHYGLDPGLVELIFSEPTFLHTTLCRTDLVDTARGPRCVEINVGNLGGWQHAAFGPLLRRVPEIDRFLAAEGIEAAPRNSVRELFAHVAEDCRRWDPVVRDGALNLLVLASDGGGGTGPETHPASVYRRELAAVLAELGLEGRVEVAPLSALEVDRRGLKVGSHRFHAVVEQNDTRPDPRVYRAAKQGLVRQYTGPLGMVLGDKRNLAMLSLLEDSDLLDREERSLVRDGIPWTRLVQPGRVRYRGERRNLPELLVEERADLVLKAGFSYGGTEVLIGRATPVEAWSGAVEKALAAGDWVVQEYLEPLPYAAQAGEEGWAPHDVVWGLFVFGERPGGVFVRMAPRGDAPVLNIARGARIGVAFEVEAA